MGKTSKKLPKRRVTWGFNPVSRVVPSARRYRRSRSKSELRQIISGKE